MKCGFCKEEFMTFEALLTHHAKGEPHLQTRHAPFYPSFLRCTSSSTWERIAFTRLYDIWDNGRQFEQVMEELFTTTRRLLHEQDTPTYFQVMVTYTVVNMESSRTYSRHFVSRSWRMAPDWNLLDEVFMNIYNDFKGHLDNDNYLFEATKCKIILSTRPLPRANC